MRRYAAANELDAHVVLTFDRNRVGDCRMAKKYVGDLMRRLRKRNGAAFPYVFVLESRPDGHGLHVHALMPARIAELVDTMWSYGHADWDPTGRLRTIEEIREKAGYITKDFDTSTPSETRYTIGRGFPVEVERSCVESRHEGEAELIHRMGAASERWTGDREGCPLVLRWSAAVLLDDRRTPTPRIPRRVVAAVGDFASAPDRHVRRRRRHSANLTARSHAQRRFGHPHRVERSPESIS